jgi:signal transduction histidine kinase
LHPEWSLNITINVSIEPDTKVNADENMLNTVIRNLISNAIKYTHNNGYVQVFSEIREINKRKFSVIGVKDNGVGIPANKQNKIFNIEDNYTTNGTGKEKGTGLGLILCKEFVEKHNGRIWCESQENQGSTFYFSLPFN